MTRSLSSSQPKNWNFWVSSFDDNYPNRMSEDGSFECFLQKLRQNIWVVSIVTVMIIAAIPGVKHGAQHYHTLESEKTAALRHNDYNEFVAIPPPPLVAMEIQWWHTNISTSHYSNLNLNLSSIFLFHSEEIH